MRNRFFRIRFAVMIACIAVVAVGYFIAGDFGSICGVGFGDITLLCPLGALFAMLSQRTLIPMALISIAGALAACVVLGKVFCAWVCPMHFMVRRKKGDRTRTAGADASTSGMSHACASCTKPCGKTTGVKIDSRHAVLAGAALSSLIFGFPVFCLVCPVGLTFATVLLVMRLFAFGETTWTIIIYVAIIAAEALLAPRWCSHLCPLGAALSLMSAPNRTLRPAIDESRCVQTSQGKQCNLCVAACPEEINLHDVALGATTLNDCSKCRGCADACPSHAISFPLIAPKTGACATAAQPEGDLQ